MRNGSALVRIRSRINWAIVSFWIIALVPFFLENGSGILNSLSSECRPNSAEFGSIYESARRWLGKLDPFAPSPDNVVLVTYSVGYEGRYLMGNFCDLRKFTARVLERRCEASWNSSMACALTGPSASMRARTSS